MHKAHTSYHSLCLGSLVHLLRLAVVHRQRLFTEHVLPGLDGRHGHRIVHIVGRAYAHRVHEFRVDQFMVVCRQLFDSVRRTNTLERLFVHIAQHRDLDILTAQVAWNVLPQRDASDSDNADPQLRYHRTCSPLSSRMDALWAWKGPGTLANRQDGRQPLMPVRVMPSMKVRCVKMNRMMTGRVTIVEAAIRYPHSVECSLRYCCRPRLMVYFFDSFK